MDAERTVYRLLCRALLDMRIHAYESKDNLVFHLCDLMHNLPARIERATHGEDTFEAILETLQQRARDKGCASWVDHQLAEEQAIAEPNKTQVTTP